MFWNNSKKIKQLESRMKLLSGRLTYIEQKYKFLKHANDQILKERENDPVTMISKDIKNFFDEMDRISKIILDLKKDMEKHPFYSSFISPENHIFLDKDKVNHYLGEEICTDQPYDPFIALEKLSKKAISVDHIENDDVVYNKIKKGTKK